MDWLAANTPGSAVGIIQVAQAESVPALTVCPSLDLFVEELDIFGNED